MSGELRCCGKPWAGTPEPHAADCPLFGDRTTRCKPNRPHVWGGWLTLWEMLRLEQRFCERCGKKQLRKRPIGLAA